MKLTWSARAEADLAEACLHVAFDKPNAATVVEDQIIAAVEVLRLFPESGREGGRAGTREAIVRGAPYLIVYQILGDRVRILRVWHTSRRPHR